MQTSNPNSLSKQFAEYIGLTNLKDPGNPEEWEVYYIQKALIEVHCVHNDKPNSPISWVPKDARLNSVGQAFVWRCPVGPQHTGYSAALGLGPIETYVELYRHVVGCTLKDAVQKLASDCGLNPEQLFGKDGGTVKEQPRPAYQAVRGSFATCVVSPPEEIIISEATYKICAGRVVFSTASKGSRWLELLCYANESGLIYVPLHARQTSLASSFNSQPPQYELTYGLGGGPLPLYNLHLIDAPRAEASTVFLCDDLKVAVALSAVIADSKRLGDDQYHATELYVASGWYGGARLLDKVDFKPLWRSRRVVFIPAVNRTSYRDTVRTVKNHCLEAGVKDFRIYRPAVLKEPPNYGAISTVNDIVDPWERYLAKSAVSLRDCESLRIKRMAEEATSWDDYQHWGESVGIFPLSDIGKAQGHLASFSKTHNLSQLRVNFPLEEGAGPRLDLLGTYNNITVIYGDKNSSKSMLAMAVAVGRAGGQSFLDFEAMPEPSKVLYVDGELRGEAFLERLERTMSAFRCNQKLVEDNLNFMLLHGDQLCDNIDLEDERQKNEIEEKIRYLESELVIFDNLQSLLAGFRSNNSTLAWKSFHGWLLELERKYKTGFLVIHHDNADGGTAGSSKIEWQATTLIHLMGKDSLKKALDKKDQDADLEMYQKYLTKPGALFRATGRTKYRSLDLAPFGGFLLNTSSASSQGISGPPWQPIGHVLSARQRGSFTESDEALRAEVRSKHPDRTEDEYKILEFLYIRSYVKIHEICKVLAPDKKDGCSPSTALNRIKPLLEGGIVDRIGQAGSTRYKLRDDLDDQDGGPWAINPS